MIYSVLLSLILVDTSSTASCSNCCNRVIWPAVEEYDSLGVVRELVYEGIEDPWAPRWSR